ncbi:MAG: hypothetical protein LLG20_18250 [Acidobacteriales bacterium]|nr:hypothetical protein [Terriglobales bacterium]
MTLEQARERARKIRTVDFARGQARFDDVIARELLLAQAEAYEDAAKRVRERADETNDEPGEFYRGARNNLCAQAAKLETEAAELRRAAEEAARA